MLRPTSLVDQFCQAVERYLASTGDAEENVAGLLMLMLGGDRVIKGRGALSREELASRDSEKLRAVDIHGRYEIAHLRQWLNHLVTEVGILDVFLTPALIRFYEGWETNRLLGYDEGVQRQQEMADSFRRMIESKEARDEYFDDLARRRSRITQPEDDDARVERLKSTLSHLESMNRESVDRIRDKLQAWRDYTRDIASDENTKRYLDEMTRAEWDRENTV